MGYSAGTLELNEDNDWSVMQEDPIGKPDLVESPQLPRQPAVVLRPLGRLLFNGLF
jgi:hypothetical protein